VWRDNLVEFCVCNVPVMDHIVRFLYGMRLMHDERAEVIR